MYLIQLKYFSVFTKRLIQLFFLLFFFIAHAQNQRDSLPIKWHFFNDNFFYNREYYNLIADSYTIAGHIFRPELSMKIYPGWSLNGGADILGYWGYNGHWQIKPVFYVAYVHKNHYFRFGALENRYLHKIIRPLLQSDYIYHPDKRVETGMQYIFSSEKIEWETWINWQNFIKPADSTREVIQLGTRFSVHLIRRKKMRLKFPLQVLVHHRGGQINLRGSFNSDINNLFVVLYGASGIQVVFPFNNKGELNLFGYGLGHYINSDNTEDLKFRYGSAFWIGAAWYRNNFRAGLSYWEANRFIAPTGEDIFQTVSRRMEIFRSGDGVIHLYSLYAEPHRKLWIGDVSYYHNFSEQFVFRIAANIFYQPYVSFIPGYNVYPVKNQADYLIRLEWIYYF